MNDNYKTQSGEDLIARWFREESPGIFRAKMSAHIEAYLARMGKKDLPISEVRKILIFAQRWFEYEQEYQKLNLHPYNKGITPHDTEHSSVV